MAGMLAINTSLEKLSIGGAALGDAGVAVLAPAVTAHRPSTTRSILCLSLRRWLHQTIFHGEEVAAAS